MDPRNPWVRLLAVTALAAFVGVSFAVFWNFPATDEDGEGLGHVLAHIVWGTAGILLVAWFARHRRHASMRASFRHEFGATLTGCAFLAVAFFQIVAEAPGAAVIWQTGSFALHDASIMAVTFPAHLLTALGLLIWAGQAIRRRLRGGRLSASARPSS